MRWCWCFRCLYYICILATLSDCSMIWYRPVVYNFCRLKFESFLHEPVSGRGLREKACADWAIVVSDSTLSVRCDHESCKQRQRPIFRAWFQFACRRLTPRSTLYRSVNFSSLTQLKIGPWRQYFGATLCPDLIFAYVMYTFRLNWVSYTASSRFHHPWEKLCMGPLLASIKHPYATHIHQKLPQWGSAYHPCTQ